MQNVEDYAHFRDTMPVASVDLVVFNSEGKALLGTGVNEPARGTLFVPGGRMWKDESLADATRRISRSQFGVELSPNALWARTSRCTQTRRRDAIPSP